MPTDGLNHEPFSKDERVGTEQFVASLVASLAWPAAAASMVFVLRRPIVRMLRDRQIQSLEAGPSGVKLSFFDDQIKDAKKELAEASVGQDEVTEPSAERIADITAAQSDFMEEMHQLAKVAPRAVVLESYARLEEVLRNTVHVTGQERSRYRGNISIRNLARKAVEQGLLTPSEMAAFDDVSVVRNILSHEGAGDLDASRALSYADIAGQLIRSITTAAERQSGSDTYTRD
jgi:hypothetical protein